MLKNKHLPTSFTLSLVNFKCIKKLNFTVKTLYYPVIYNIFGRAWTHGGRVYGSLDYMIYLHRIRINCFLLQKILLTTGK